MWFVFAIICLLGWGLADLFYKKSNDASDNASHLKTTVWVGLVMGTVALALFLFGEHNLGREDFFKKLLLYSPASLCYILSMVIGYAGLRYLELSVVSPVQNASGGLSSLCMAVYLLLRGYSEELRETFSAAGIIGTACIVIGVVLLAVVEQKEDAPRENEKKYTHGALALLFPIGYCVFDTLGTAADGLILGEGLGVELGEIDVLILYGLTFFLAAVVCWFILLFKEKKAYNPFRLSREKNRAAAALAEEFGQVFYVFAMAGNPMLAAPLVSSYCIVSLLLSRIILKEKLSLKKYLTIVLVVIGILILAVTEEM